MMKLVKLFVESVSARLPLPAGELWLIVLSGCLCYPLGRPASRWKEGTDACLILIIRRLTILFQCGHLGGKVLVPTSTHISRLIASRFQTDLMKSTMLLIARTDSESGKLISSTVDAADHEFILGVTKTDSQPLAQVIAEAEATGASGAEIDRLEKAWMDEHPLSTFDQGDHSIHLSWIFNTNSTTSRCKRN